MNDLSQFKAETPAARPLARVRAKLLPLFRRHRSLGIAVIVSLLCAVYWLLIASDRYISEAHVVVHRTDMAGGESFDFASLLGGSVGGNRADQLLLRDHLLSIDMLKTLDAQLDLRTHFSDWRRDPFSRMWFADAPIEKFHRYYLARVSIDFDEYAGVLVIKAQGFDPNKAQAITNALVAEGERFMNSMAHTIAQNQVAFLERQVSLMNERSIVAQQAVLDYQNREGLVSPLATTETIAAVIGKLQAQRTELETQRSALTAYLVADHPNIVQLTQQIAAIDHQIGEEQSKLTSPDNKALNRSVEEFLRLKRKAEFADSLYKTALVALEKGRIEAIRTIKKLSILQQPTAPEYALEPRRLYNTLVFTLVAFLLAGVVHLLAAIVRDHKD